MNNNLIKYKLKNNLINHDILYNYYIKYKGGANPIPSLLYAILEFYNPKSTKKGGYADDIAKYVHSRYVKYNSNLAIRSIKENSKLKFTITKIISDDEEKKKLEPLLNMGTFTAVYKINDINNNINDNIDGEYILRIYDRQTSVNMYSSNKIKDEYKLFSEYMSKIYYYGEIQKEYLTAYTHRETLQTYDYTITKLYNTPVFNTSYDIINLTNLQKIKYLLNNLDMLNTLYENKYIHLDYKITNIAWENPDTMNVILIDYDNNTLFKIDSNDELFQFDETGKMRIAYSSTYVPQYLSNDKYKLLRLNWDKYSIAGFENIYNSLNIEYVSPTIDNINPPIKLNDRISFSNLNFSTILQDLKINDHRYELIPTYSELLEFFLNIGIAGFIKDVKKEDLI